MDSETLEVLIRCLCSLVFMAMGLVLAYFGEGQTLKYLLGSLICFLVSLEFIAKYEKVFYE